MMRKSSTAIEVENLTQRFRLIHERPDTLRELFTKRFRGGAKVHNFEALKNVSFDVYGGEMVAIIGANGCGKSTLLKAIAGVYKPSSGRVEVKGSMASLLELGAGFHPELTGRENIILNGLLMGYSKRQMLAREEKITDFAGIGDFVDVPVKQYSSGMYMRLAFSVATEVDPEILIIDEILAVGDAPFQAKCFDRLKKFRAAGKTILFVTHSVQHVLSTCDRAIYLKAGEVMVNGTPVEALEAYAPGSVEAASALADASSHFFESVEQ
jgi:ABC-type polysaccharide/polyol phosphate transport system ATPase subunit